MKTGLPDGIEQLARERAGDDWREVLDEAVELASRIRFLPWPDRARALDGFCWQRAQTQLSIDEVTGVVNRSADYLRHSGNVRAFADRTSAVVASVLLIVGEAEPVTSDAAALVFLLSGHPPLQERALGWLDAAGAEGLRPAMAAHPGFAFLFLVLYPNDSAESFMARDAFWSAMLGL